MTKKKETEIEKALRRAMTETPTFRYFYPAGSFFGEHYLKPIEPLEFVKPRDRTIKGWAIEHRKIKPFVPTKEEMERDTLDDIESVIEYIPARKEPADPPAELRAMMEATRDRRLHQFEQQLLRSMAAGLGISFEQLSGDYRKVHTDMTPEAVWKRNRAAGMKDVTVNEMVFEGKTFTRHYYTGSDDLRVLAVECDGVIVERTTIL